MRFGDLFRLSLENLWRTRLRSALTTLGVVIGIGVLVSMVSFGTGIQKNVTEGFRENVWNFSLETDLASMMALFAALDEWSDKQDALHDAKQKSAVGGGEAGPDEAGPDEEGPDEEGD